MLPLRGRAKSNKGQSLLEMLLALMVMVLVVTALVKLTTTAIRNADFAKSKALATQYAQESLEEARWLRDQDATTFFVADSCDQEDTIAGFTRRRDCELSGDAKSMTVRVTVSWESRGRNHQVELATELTKWK